MAPDPYYRDELVTLHAGDCREVLAAMEAASIDAVVTDPPYDLTSGKKGGSGAASLNLNSPAGRSRIGTGGGFMGREWDATGVAFDPETWRRCLRVLKPGGHLLAFGGTRTYHRMTCAIEDAGFEIRDSLHWIYGSGFPKGKTCLKPAHEPIVLARKSAKRMEPFPGLDACRVEGSAGNGHWIRNGEMGTQGIYGGGGTAGEDFGGLNPAAGRWPPNILLTHSADCKPAGMRQVRGCGGPKRTDSGDTSIFGIGQPGHVYGEHGLETIEAWDCAEGCPVAEMDIQSGDRATSLRRKHYDTPATNQVYGDLIRSTANPDNTYGDSGGASRFFPVFRYQAKAPASERPKLADGTTWPTVKPLELMRWLVRLVTPPGGTVLDPFAGTGTTAEACAAEGFRCILAERDPVALQLIGTRLCKPAQAELFT